MYDENKSVTLLQALCNKDEVYFIERISNQMDTNQYITLYDTLTSLLNDHKSLFELVFRLKKIIKAANKMNASLVLNDTIEKIKEWTCICLECDRAHLFIVDHEKEELYSKMQKGVEIRMGLSEGIAGYVASKGETVNILDAYQDDRFNKDIDVATNYKTNTILCVPIQDENKKTVGVI